MKLLFIGNSATHVHNIPKLLTSLVSSVGIELEADMITGDGYELSRHIEDGGVFEKINEGYDMVFLQEHGNCIAEEKRESSLSAMRRLGEAVTKSGAELYYYVRPPYGIKNRGYDSLQQCELFDAHFKKSQEETGAKCVFVNRAFANAIKETDIKLWGEDNAHASEYGAYLIAATFFATLFNKSATLLPSATLPEIDAKILAEIADETVFKEKAPWIN